MYVEIKENKLLSYCKNSYLDYEFVEIDYSTFDPEKFEVQNNQLVDISNTEEYKAKIAEEQKKIKNAELQKSIEEFEKTQLRATRELIIDPSNAFSLNRLKSIDVQIQDLRAQMSASN